LKDFSSVLFNNDWKFLLGDNKNAHSVNFNDRTWKRVDLPHDWVIGRPFNRGKEGGYTAQNMQGFFAWEGICWYRKEFTLMQAHAKTVYIRFGGAYRNSKVFVNGKEAGGRACGYSSFEIDISAFVIEGKNLIAVRLDNGCEATDRWYSGSGLFRNVFLKVVPKTHIKTWGVHVKTKLSADKKQAEITVSTTIINRGSTNESGVENGAESAVCLRILAPDGKVAAESSVPFSRDDMEEIAVKQIVSIKNPLLWSDERPRLYRALVYLETDGKKGEPVETGFGIRAMEIAYNSGMTVNGRKVKLKGVCLHHDAGITGSAY